jgi:hypothetical protein
MNIFNLADLQLQREKKTVTIDGVIDRAKIIRNFIAKNKNTVERICAGVPYSKAIDGRIRMLV